VLEVRTADVLQDRLTGQGMVLVLGYLSENARGCCKYSIMGHLVLHGI